MRMIYSMKRKVALVAACIMCSLTASAAVSTTSTGGCDGNHSGYTAISGTKTITTAGNYYLTQNVFSGASWPLKIQCSGTVTLCLNGYDIYQTGDASVVVDIVATGGDLTVNLCDCKGTGEIYRNNRSYTGISLRGDSSNGYYATLNMYGGTIRYCSTGVCGYGNTRFNMYGGTIKDSLYDGVYQDSSDDKVNIYGGTITGNLEGIRVCSADGVTLTGSPSIYGNTNGDIYYRESYPITVKDLSVSQKMTLGFYDAADFTVAIVDTADALHYFECVRRGQNLSYSDGKILLHTGTATYTVNAEDSTKHDVTFSCCGTTVTEGHTLTDDANDNVITASCSKCEYVTATATITATNATYDGTAQETATVAYGTGWTGDKNLTITYANNVDAGTATASITIGGVTARTTFTIHPKEITGAAVAIEQGASFVYSGEPFTPAVSVTLDGKPLAASDYQVSYAGNVNAGQAMVTVTGRGNYSGSATATFTIAKAPAPTLPAATVSRNYAVAKVSVPTGIVAGEGSSVSVGTASGSGSDKVAAVTLDAKGNLTFTLSGGANGDEIVLPVHLHSPNYEGPITATVTVTLTDKLDQRPLTVKATSTTVPSAAPARGRSPMRSSMALAQPPSVAAPSPVVLPARLRSSPPRREPASTIRPAASRLLSQ